MNYTIREWETKNGAKFYKIELIGTYGQSVEILNFGGIVHAWNCLDKHGNLTDILLGCQYLEDYHEGHPYFGAIIGRYANRIKHGRFTVHDIEYHLNTNLPPHHLHGGLSGFDKKTYDFTVDKNQHAIILTLSAVSPHMEEGYPGELTFKIKYIYDDKNRLTIDYEAQTTLPTHVNLTNHCYFNLGGQKHKNVLDHDVKIHSSKITQVDETLIPTGHIITVEGTPLDLIQYKNIGKAVKQKHPIMQNTKGFDHNYVLDSSGKLQLAAEVCHVMSGRRLRVYTNQPGIQLYTGNWLSGVKGKNGTYEDYAGLCLETQHFPDTPNRPEFPSTLLKPSETYQSRTVYDIDVWEND